MSQLKLVENEDNVRKILHAKTKALEVILQPTKIDLKRFQASIVNAIRENPKLLNCSLESFLNSVMHCCRLGLEPGLLGQCYLIPYKDECTFMLGYRGMLTLLWRSGMIASVEAHTVYTSDKFEFKFGLNPELEHIPSSEKSENALAYYCIIKFINGEKVFDVMFKHEVDKIKARSRAGNFGPWTTDYNEMAKKTLLRRMWKWNTLSDTLQMAISIDELTDRNETYIDTDLGIFEEIKTEKPDPTKQLMTELENVTFKGDEK